MNVGKLTSRKLQSAVAGLGLVALLAAASFAHGASGPFTNMSGAWAGRGAVTLASGTKENIRCKANYNVDGGGANLKLSLRCSSDSFKFELESNVAHNNGQVSGHWSEMTHRVGGTVTGKVAGDRIQVRVDGTIAAMLEINTRADHQSVSIQSPGSPMTAVVISLSRASKQTAMK
jgi:hypothetical protein